MGRFLLNDQYRVVFGGRSKFSSGIWTDYWEWLEVKTFWKTRISYHFHGHNTERTLQSNLNKVINTLSMIRTNFIAKLHFWNCSTYRTLAFIPNHTKKWLCTRSWTLKFALVLVTNMYIKNNYLFMPSDIKISSATFHCYFPSVREKHLTS